MKIFLLERVVLWWTCLDLAAPLHTIQPTSLSSPPSWTYFYFLKHFFLPYSSQHLSPQTDVLHMSLAHMPCSSVLCLCVHPDLQCCVLLPPLSLVFFLTPSFFLFVLPPHARLRNILCGHVGFSSGLFWDFLLSCFRMPSPLPPFDSATSKSRTGSAVLPTIASTSPSTSPSILETDASSLCLNKQSGFCWDFRLSSFESHHQHRSWFLQTPVR